MRSSTTGERPHPAPRNVGVGTGVVVAMSIAAWWPAFTLGAWGTLFFDQLLTVWAGSTAALIAVAVGPRRQSRRGLTIAALSAPSIWLILALSAEPDSTEALLAAVDIAAFLAGLIGIPVTIFVLSRIVWPDLAKNTSRPQRVAAVAIVVAIAAASFGLGANQSQFLTCQDFTISGNSEPPGCVSQ